MPARLFQTFDRVALVLFAALALALPLAVAVSGFAR
jgi:hypothetical protein